MRDDAGLAAARPGQHQQRPVAVEHGLALRFGERFEEWFMEAVGGQRSVGMSHVIISALAVGSYIPSARAASAARC